MTAADDLLVDLWDLDEAAVGGKAFNLGRIAKLGIATPGGAVIPDAVFQRHLERAGVDTEARVLTHGGARTSENGIEAATERVRQAILNTDLECSLKAALNQGWYDRWERKRLAVRSSAVGEDSAHASFAGQLSSFLNVDSIPALESAVKSVWASLFSPQVLGYARRHGLRIGHMGVIVQRQVDARLSGVLFTRDPRADRKTMLVEHCWGLAQGLVDGALTPSRSTIDRYNFTLSAEHVADEAALLDPPAVEAIREIARRGLMLEERYRVPQDVEWCIDHDGNPIIVQTRPVTGRAKRNQQRSTHWSNANISENFPDPVSPFLYSIVKPGYSAYFRNLGHGFGISEQRLRAMAESLEHIVGLHAGRLYYNLTNIHSVIQLMPMGRRLVEYFNLFVGADEIPAPPAVRLSSVARIAETARIARSIFWKYVSIEKRIRRFERTVDDFAANTHPRKLVDKSAHALGADLAAFMQIRLTRWNDAALADTAAMVCYGLLKALLARAYEGGDQSAVHNNLLKGLPDLASTEPVTRLWYLSRDIEADPELRAIFSNDDGDRILQGLADPCFEHFNGAFAEYLDRFGFRSSGELMLTAPTPQEDPRALLRLLASYVGSNAESPASVTERQMRERRQATEDVAAKLSPIGFLRAVPLLSAASRFRILLAATQGAIKLRERARLKQALLYTRLRHIALQIGDRLVECGVLSARDDVFLLTVDEVRDLISSRPNPCERSELNAAIELRREALRVSLRQHPPDRLELDEGEEWQASPPSPKCAADESPKDLLHGNGACGGSAIGPAAVVLDVACAGHVQSGQILVTRQTDPGWAAVFFLVRGLVIERGGMLSHGAIIAREYGIPAVVGVHEATRLIEDGVRLRVDGDHGLVELLRS